MGHGIRAKAKGRVEGTPEWLLAIDPGRGMGWAIFHKGRLFLSGHCTMAALRKGKLSSQAIRAGHALPPDVEPECVLLGELPEYRGRQAGDNKSTPRDLIALSCSLGQAIGLYMRKVEVVEFVTPTTWKGSVPKDICHRRIEDALGSEEQMPENHNARDAVGIGLWRLRRYRR